jgi:hypothetical protein
MPVQRVTSSGILKVKGEPYKWANRTWFHPDSTITVKEFSDGLNAFDSNFMVVDEKSVLTVKKAAELLSLLLDRNIYMEMNNILITKSEKKSGADNPITKRELAIVSDELVHPFVSKEIGFDGNYK